MFNISLNHIITINRGDSGSFTFFLNKGTTVNPEIIEQFDKVYFGVMQPEDKFEKAILRKIYTQEDLNEDKSLTINFKPTDTELLVPGVYYYEVKVEVGTAESGEEADVYTVVPRTKFIILE